MQFFQVTSDLLNSENLKIAIAQLYNELHICNLTMLQLTQKSLINTFKKKYSKCKCFQFTTDLLNSENLKIAIAQLCNALQVCNLTML